MVKKLPYILLIAILVIGVYFVLFGQSSSNQSEQAPIKPSPTYVPSTIPQTSLWLEPNPVYINTAGLVSFDVYISTKENKAKSVQLEVSYDPKKLKFVSVKPVELLAKKHVFINKIDAVNGRISFGVENTPGSHQPPIEGTDEIGELVFSPRELDGSSTEVAILPESVVHADGVEKSVLVSTKNAKVILQKSTQKNDE